MVDTVAALGSLSQEELESMRSLSKQRLPIQSKHVEALLEYVEQIRREARDKALEEAITKAEYAFAAAKAQNGPYCKAREEILLGSIRGKIRALKDKGE